MNLEKIIYNLIAIILIVIFFGCVLWLCPYYNKNFKFQKEQEIENETKNIYLLKESNLSKALIV